MSLINFRLLLRYNFIFILLIINLMILIKIITILLLKATLRARLLIFFTEMLDSMFSIWKSPREMWINISLYFLLPGLLNSLKLFIKSDLKISSLLIVILDKLLDNINMSISIKLPQIFQMFHGLLLFFINSKLVIKLMMK